MRVTFVSQKNPAVFVFPSLLEMLLQPTPQLGLGFLSWWKSAEAFPWFGVGLCYFLPFFIELVNGKLWEESVRGTVGVAIFPTEAEGARKAVRFLTLPSFPTSPGTHLCDDSHPKHGDQAKQGHLSGQVSILLLMGNAISVWQSCGEKTDPRQLLNNLDLSTCFCFGKANLSSQVSFY